MAKHIFVEKSVVLHLLDKPQLRTHHWEDREENKSPAGFKPTTTWLRGVCSTTELQPQGNGGWEQTNFTFKFAQNFCFHWIGSSSESKFEKFWGKKSSFSTFRRQEKRILRKEKNRKGLINGFSEGWSHLDVDKSIRFVLIESHRFLLIVETGAATSRSPRLLPERQIGWKWPRSAPRPFFQLTDYRQTLFQYPNSWDTFKNIVNLG